MLKSDIAKIHDAGEALSSKFPIFSKILVALLIILKWICLVGLIAAAIYYLAMGLRGIMGTSRALEISDGSVVALYHMEDGLDSSGNGYDLENNSVNFGAGLLSSAARFDLNTDYLRSMPLQTLFNGPSWALSLWVNQSSEITEPVRFLSQSHTSAPWTGESLVYKYRNGTPLLQLCRTRYDAPNSQMGCIDHEVSLGTSDWHHVLLSYENNVLRGYYDGILVGDIPASGDGVAGLNWGFVIGNQAERDPKTAFIGSIDEVVVFARGVSLDEVAKLYNDGRGREVCVEKDCGHSGAIDLHTNATPTPLPTWIPSASPTPSSPTIIPTTVTPASMPLFNCGSGNYIAFYSERSGSGDIYVYEMNNSQVYSFPTINTRARETAPSMPNSCLLAFQRTNRGEDVFLYDIAQGAFIDLPNINDQLYDDANPTLTADGQLVAYTTARFHDRKWEDILLYDRASGVSVEPPGLNTHDPGAFHEGLPRISADGRFILYRSIGDGGEDLKLYDRLDGSSVQLPNLNSGGQDTSPSLSADNRYIAFQSDRQGVDDIYLYDRHVSALVSLPGLNEDGISDKGPSISADGRYIAFSSDQRGSSKEDIFLYDRITCNIFTLPGMNDKSVRDAIPWISFSDFSTPSSPSYCSDYQ